MSCKYALALYEMICLRTNLDRCMETIDLQKFRKLVRVPADSYERGDNLMRFVIRPALLEVNGLSDTGVDIQLVRSHSRADHGGNALLVEKDRR
jgi:Initiator Replication protein